MRLWILSDLHLEYAALRRPLDIPDADVCVIAGDLCRGVDNGVSWLAEHVANEMPCIYVAGNHEFYKSAVREGLVAGRQAAARHPNVHFLENAMVSIQGIRFVGATLWTDFRLGGNPLLAMSHARERMNDYRQIAAQRNPWRRLVPETTYRMHLESRRFVESALNDGTVKTVVVTHHLPLEQSILPRLRGEVINAAYASDLSSLVGIGKPALWVHGHSHESCDYWVGTTRVVNNPRGYSDENASFDSKLVVTV